MKDSLGLNLEKEKFISASDAAKLCGYHRIYVGQLCRAGKIDCRKFGTDWLVSEPSILGYKKQILQASVAVPMKTEIALTVKASPILQTKDEPKINAIVQQAPTFRAKDEWDKELLGERPKFNLPAMLRMALQAGIPNLKYPVFALASILLAVAVFYNSDAIKNTAADAIENIKVSAGKMRTILKTSEDRALSIAFAASNKITDAIENINVSAITPSTHITLRETSEITASLKVGVEGGIIDQIVFAKDKVLDKISKIPPPPLIVKEGIGEVAGSLLDKERRRRGENTAADAIENIKVSAGKMRTILKTGEDRALSIAGEWGRLSFFSSPLLKGEGQVRGLIADAKVKGERGVMKMAEGVKSGLDNVFSIAKTNYFAIAFATKENLLALSLPDFSLPEINLQKIKLTEIQLPKFSLSFPSFQSLTSNFQLPFNVDDIKLSLSDLKTRFAGNLFAWRDYILSLGEDIKKIALDFVSPAEMSAPVPAPQPTPEPKIITFEPPATPQPPQTTPPPTAPSPRVRGEEGGDGVDESSLTSRILSSINIAQKLVEMENRLNNNVQLLISNIEKRIPHNIQNPVVFMTASAPSPYRNDPPQQVSGVSAGFGDFSQGVSTGGNLSAKGNIILGDSGKSAEITSSSWKITTAGAFSGITSLSADSLTASTLNISSATLSGGSLTFSSAATTTILSSAINAFSFATSTTVTPLFTFDTLNYRVGIGTTSPGATFAVSGNMLASGGLNVSGASMNVNSTTTLTEQLSVTKSPTVAHSFGTWAVGTANSAVTDAVVIINPASAASDTNLLGIAVNGSVKFLVDADGDVFANGLTTVGGTTLASTTASTFTVENSFFMGDAPNSDSHTFKGRITHFATTTGAAYTMWNSTVSGDLLRLQTGATSPTTSFVFSAAGQAAFGTTTNSGLSVLTIGATTTNSIPLTIKAVTSQSADLFRVLSSSDSSLFNVTSAGNLGIGTASPAEQLQITGNFRLASTTASVGIIKVGVTRFIHSYGTSSFFAGESAGNFTLTANQSTGVGYLSLNALTSGNQNTAFGNLSLRSLTSGAQNTAMGSDAGGLLTTGSDNAFIGQNAAPLATTANDNVVIGTGAGFNMTTATQNVIIGSEAGQTLPEGTVVFTGTNNVAIGYQAFRKATGAASNVAVGMLSMTSLTTGSRNVAIGTQVLNDATTGSDNVAIGKDTALRLTTGSGNIVIGREAGWDGTGDVNNITTGTSLTYVGDKAGQNTASQFTNATAIGANAKVGASNSLILGAIEANAVKVGIGTTSPYAKLSIHAGSAESVTNLFAVASSTASATSTFFVINNTGNVGIGTTGPTSKLELGSGVLTLPAGSASAPSLTFSGDTDTGIYNSADVIRFTVAGGNSMSLQDGGGVDTLSLSDTNIQLSTGRRVCFSASCGESIYAPGDGSVSIFTNSETRRMTVDTNGNIGIGTTTPAQRLSVHGNALISGNLTSVANITATGTITHNAFAYANQTASTELTDANFNLARSVEFASGNLATQRAFRIQAPTYTFTASSTLTDASTLSISGAPVAGVRATTTNVYGLNIAAGSVIGAGAIAPTNAYGLYVSAPTGATNNYGAVFASGNVGIGTTTPQKRFHTHDATQSQMIATGWESLFGAENNSGSIQIGGTNANTSATLHYEGASVGSLYIDNNYDSAATKIHFRLRTSGTPVSALVLDATGLASVGSLKTTGNIELGGTTGERLRAGAAASYIELFHATTGDMTFFGTYATGKINFNTGNNATPRMVVDGSGNVGIGTTSPGALLSVAGAGLFNSGITSYGTLNIPIFNATSTTATSTISGGLTIETTGFVYDYSTNRVGIGTAPRGGDEANTDLLVSSTGEAYISVESSDSGGSPAFRLLQNGTLRGILWGAPGGLRLDTGGTTQGFTLSGDNSTLLAGLADSTADATLEISASGGSNPIFMLSSNDANDGDRFIVTNAGNIGIGTTSPASLLAVHGNCVTGDTKLKRRQKRRRKNGKGEWVEEEYFEDTRIDEIKEGDEILTLDERTGRLVVSRVNKLMDMGTKEIYTLTTATGKQIRTTKEHPYLVAPEARGQQRIAVFIDGANFAVSLNSIGGKIRDHRAILNAFEDSENRFALARYYQVDFNEEGQGNFFTALKHRGFRLITKSLKRIKKEKGEKDENKANFDVEISFDAALRHNDFDVMALFSGDSDFDYMAKELQKLGKRVVVISPWKRTSKELRQTADMYLNLKAMPFVEMIDNQKRPRRAAKDKLSPALPILAQVRPYVNGGVWTKVEGLKEGQMIATAGQNGKPVFERIIKIEKTPAERVWDIEVEGTHNFIGNDIVAHNTYVSGSSFFGGAITATSTLNLTGLLTFGNASGTQLTTTGSTYLATSGGNVGIGTTAPGLPLELSTGNTALPATSGSTQSAGGRLRITDNGATAAVLDIGTNGGSPMWLQASQKNNLAINWNLALNPNGGNVGIGTTSPSTLLSVSGSSGLMLTNTGSGNTFYVEDAANDTTPFVIDASGNVGIGTTINPVTNLHIEGSGDEIRGVIRHLLVQDSTASAQGVGGAIVFAGEHNVSGVSHANFAAIKGIKENAIDANYASALLFYTGLHGANFAEQMRITSAGNVGIGTTTPAQRLSVHGNALISGNLTSVANITATGTITHNAFAYANQTASTELTDANFNLARSVEFASGNLATQRAFRIQAPTYTFTASSTLTDASTLSISGAPVAGVRATTTNVYGLNIAAGSVIGAGAIAPTNAYGLYVSAPTGATNNYGAVFASGNVGIGTTSPAQLLAVHGNSYVSGTGFFGSTLTATGTVNFTGTAATTTISGGLVVDTNSLVVDYSSSRVGIGTAAPRTLLEVNGSPGTNWWRNDGNDAVVGVDTLEVVSSSPQAFGIYSDSLTNGPNLNFIIRNSANNAVRGAYIGSPIVDGTAGSERQALTFFTRTNTDTGPVERVRITDSGNIGIGTTSPSTLLSVSGSSGLMLTNTGSGNTFYVEDAANDTTPFVIDASGNVGIGTTSPWGLLSVNPSGITGPAFVVGSSTQCVTGDTKLKRRRRRRKKNGEWEDEFEDVRIDEIKEGDEILTLDEKTGKLVVSRVNKLMHMGVKPIIKITTGLGWTIRTTAEHPYLVKMSSPELPRQKPRLGIFFDNANMFYAQKKADWKVDLKKLKNALSGVFDISFVNYYIATPAPSDQAYLETARYLEHISGAVTLKTKPLKYIQTAEGKLIKKGDMDVEIALDVTKTIQNLDALLVISGDSDLLPLRKYAVERGKKVVFAGFKHNMAWELAMGGKYFYFDALRGELALEEKTTSKPELGVALLSLLYSRPPSLSSGGVWTKVEGLKEGQEIAVLGRNGKPVWDKITELRELPSEDVYDIEVEGTHNFIGNDIVAHNTYLTVTNGGNVGIGTTSPSSLLHLSSTASQGGIRINSGSEPIIVFQESGVDKSYISYRGDLTPERLEFTVGGVGGGSRAMIISDNKGISIGSYATNGNTPPSEGFIVNGNVGIGTTTPAALLDVTKTSSGATADQLYLSSDASATSTASRLSFRTKDLVNATSTAALTGILTQNFNGGKGDLAFSTLRSGILTEAMRISDTGNVGIGTTSPASLLAVHGNALISGTTTVGHLIATSTLYVGSTASPNFLVTQGGNVGIGTTPSSRLEISGGAAPVNRVALIRATGGGGTVNGGNGLFFGHNNTGYLSAIGSETSSGFPFISFYSYHSDTGNTFKRASGTNLPSVLAVNDIGLLLYKTAPAGTVDADISDFTTRFVITNTGNVGIGTTTPNTLLAVVGTTTIGSLSTATQAGINIGFGGLCVDNDGTCIASTTGRISSVTSTTGNTDVAEIYLSDENLEKGEIVAAAGGTKVKKAGVGNLSGVVGVVSTDPGVILGLGPDQNDKQGYPVALVGRVPVKVSLEGGEIKIGDRITSSSVAGVGMKATTSGMTVGIALEQFNDAATTTGKILVFVNLGYSKLDSEIAGGSTTNGWLIDQVTGKMKASYTLDLDNKDIVNAKKILSASGNWSISEAGTLVVKEIKTEKLTVQNPEVAETGITIYDRATGGPVCVFSENGVLKSEAGECGSTSLTASGIAPSSTSTGSSTSDVLTSSTSDVIPPVITILGNNPAVINVGAAYSDMGVTVTDNVDQNLGYTASVDGGPALLQGAGLSLDTSTTTPPAGGHTILYTATDSAGNTATSTRTVNVVEM